MYFSSSQEYDQVSITITPHFTEGETGCEVDLPRHKWQSWTQAPKHLLFPTPWESSLGEDPLPLATVDWASPKHLSPARSAGGWGGQR